tara:strand:+ start:15 stop:302 length:288 start_codon:yes stop_codon:yes gene_type:complete
MYTSIIEIQFQPGKMDEATKMAKGMTPELGQIDGCRQFIVIDQGEDSCLVLALYDSKAQQEAAAPKAQELLGRVGVLAAAAPERKGGDVVVNATF